MKGAWSWLAKGADAVSAILYFVAFAMFIVAVFFRYVLDQPISWSQEFISLSFVWMLFWTLGLSIGLKKQISFGLVYDSMGPAGKRVFGLASVLIGGVLFAVLVPGTLEFISYISRERTASLGLSRGYEYASFGLFIVSIPVRLAGWGFRLLSPRWKEFL